MGTGKQLPILVIDEAQHLRNDVLEEGTPQANAPGVDGGSLSPRDCPGVLGAHVPVVSSPRFPSHLLLRLVDWSGTAPTSAVRACALPPCLRFPLRPPAPRPSPPSIRGFAASRRRPRTPPRLARSEARPALRRDTHRRRHQGRSRTRHGVRSSRPRQRSSRHRHRRRRPPRSTPNRDRRVTRNANQPGVMSGVRNTANDSTATFRNVG